VRDLAQTQQTYQRRVAAHARDTRDAARRE
jgi:hypothetical protein